MKNKLLILLLSFLFFSKMSFAEQFKFETSELEILNDGELIYATKGKATSSDNNLEIDALEYEYSQKSNILKAKNGTAYIKSDNIKIIFKEIFIDQNSQILTSEQNVKIFDLKKNIIIETNSINFDQKKKILKSSTTSTLRDNFNNYFTTANFNYNFFENILKLENANFKDSQNNFFEIESGFLNTKTNKLIGKDISIDLDNKSFNKENDPRLKGKSVTINDGVTKVNKGVFTTCKRRDKCPPWQISAEEIKHDKKKKNINYKNAWLKIYDVPVMYFPKFFHPDPTVKRRSGFLIPTIKNSNSGKTFLSVPYYHVASLNRDFTFTPRFYTADEFLVQTEFREKNKESNHISDFSIYNGEGDNSKSHFFYNYNKKINFSYFENSNFNLNIEKTSNDTYLKSNKLKSEIIDSYDILENSLSFNLYSDNLSVDAEFMVFENLDKNSSDRYEYILPSLNLVKKIENKSRFDGNFFLKSNNLIRNYDTNVFEKKNINDLVFNSNPKITSSGFYNNYNVIFKNVNSDTQNSNNFKEDENIYFSGLLQYNSSLPFVKKTKTTNKILKPKLSLKISPENNSKDLSEEDIKLDVNNIFNLNRVSRSDTVEGGFSLAYGNDFIIFDREKSKDVFVLKLANNLRFSENKDLPRNVQLGQKTSNFLGELLYSPNEIFKTKYNISTKNNISELNYENLITELSLNNFVTTFDYLNENNTVSKNSYLKSTLKYEVNESNNFQFSTRENKTSDLTEYYNFMYQYKNDCLTASIEYNKDYYNDRDIKPEESILFKLNIIPFGETSSPNLKQ